MLLATEPRVDRGRFLASVGVNPPQRRAARWLPSPRAPRRARARAVPSRLARACRASGRPAAVAHRPPRVPQAGRARFPRTYDTASGFRPSPRLRPDSGRHRPRALIAPGKPRAVHRAPGLRLARRVRVQNRGRPRARSPVCAMVCGALFALGVLPAPGPHYAAIQTATVSLACPRCCSARTCERYCATGSSASRFGGLRRGGGGARRVHRALRTHAWRRRRRERRRLEVGRRVGRQERGGGA